MNPDTEKRVRKLRRRHPHTAARYLLQMARMEPKREWVGRGHGDAMVTTFEVDGFEVRAQVTPDNEEWSPNGLFTDEWRPGAIQNPNWRPPGQYGEDVYRWYMVESGETVEGLVEWLRRTHGRHEAWLMANEQMLDDLREDIEADNAAVVSVEVSKAGIRLGTAMIHTRLADDMVGLYGEWFDVDPYVDSEVDELLGEALDEAKDALAKLCECPPTEES